MSKKMMTEDTMQTSAETTAIATKNNHEEKFKEDVIEVIASQQSKLLIKEIQNLLKSHFPEQTPKRLGFPSKPESQLKKLIEEEVKRQLEENSCSQIYPEEFLKSEGYKKVLESHTIYKDAKKKIKVAIQKSTIREAVRKVNREELEKRGKKVALGRRRKNPDEVLRKNEEEKININLKEAIALVLEISEDFVKESKEGSIGRSPRLTSAISCLHQYIEGKGEFA